MIGVMAVGYLGRDPEVKEVGSSSVAKFSLGCRGFKKDQTDWIDVEVWGKAAEFVVQYFKKGSSAIVRGRLELQTWGEGEGKRSKHVLKADEVRFGPKSGSDGGEEEREPEPVAASKAKTTVLDDEEIPF